MKHRPSATPALGVFLALTISGLWATSPRTPPQRVVSETAVQIDSQASAIRSSPIHSSMRRSRQERPLQARQRIENLRESPANQQCRSDLSILQLRISSRACRIPGIAARIAEASMACSPTRAPEDLGTGSECDLRRKSLKAFLQMLPAYLDPSRIGDARHPAPLFFTGITDYLQLISPEQHQQTLEAGIKALHLMPPSETRTQNAQAWAHYWQRTNPELASRFPALRETEDLESASVPDTVAFN